MTPRGTPAITVRIEPELLTEAQDAFPSERGKAGGVSLALRRLLALSLGQTLPKQYGEQDRAEEIDTLEAEWREAQGDRPEEARKIWSRARELLVEGEWDPVERLRLLALYAETHLVTE